MYVMKRLLLPLLALTLLGTACDRASDTTTTTMPSAVVTTSSTEAPVETIVAEDTIPETTTTIASSVIHLEYQVRFKGTTDGKTVVILQIDEGTATDIALESLARQAVDEFEPLTELFVVDAEEAIELVRVDPSSLTDEEKSVLAQHWLLHVKDAVLSFKGPFSGLDGFILGS